MSEQKKPLVTNAADEAQVAKAAQKMKELESQDFDDLRHVLSSRQGRRFYWKLMGYCGVFKSSMTGNSQTFFNEGMRKVGLKLLSDLNLAEPEAYLKMVTEERDEQQ